MGSTTTTERTLTAHEAATMLDLAADHWEYPRIGPGRHVVYAPKHLRAGDELLAPHVGVKWIVLSIHDTDLGRHVYATLLSETTLSTMLLETEVDPVPSCAQQSLAAIYRTLAEKVRETGLGVPPGSAFGRMVEHARRDVTR